MRFDTESLAILAKALGRLEEGFSGLPEVGGQLDASSVEAVLLEVADRMQDNYPYFHPLYAGQMLKPPHPIARLAYALSLWINPNNHALDGGRASSRMEKEAVADIARMFGWETHLGHLCGGGTMANLEALWVSGRLRPGKKVVASDQAHYTHRRISDVLQLPFESVPCDLRARMDIDALEALCKGGEVGTVVATMGTTSAGAVDPLPRILELRDKYGFRVHADAAYGGYFTLVDELRPGTRSAFNGLAEADSIAIDPHKHGLQPYGCGCVLFGDPEVGTLYSHDSPYTYFTSTELHLGEISLECSRAGASAVALWATQRLMPFVRGGEFAWGLTRSRRAALELFRRIEEDSRFNTLFAPELDIVVWAPRADRASVVSRLSQRCFEAAAERGLHLALARFPAQLAEKWWPDVRMDGDDVVCLRSCLMKPEHLEWVDRIWGILDEAVGETES